jgi:PAS domain S-box-containing protein
LDITELRKKEGELKESQEYATTLVKSMPLPTSVMNSEGKRIDTNLTTEKLFKRPREEIIGLKTEELYAKEDLDKIKSALEECKKIDSSTCEVTALRGDGTTFPAILNFSLVKDERGNVVNVLISTTDITELRKRQREQANAILSLSKVLSKTAQGDLSARVNTKGWSEELEVIGMAVNTLIESLEVEKKEKS